MSFSDPATYGVCEACRAGLTTLYVFHLDGQKYRVCRKCYQEEPADVTVRRLAEGRFDRKLEEAAQATDAAWERNR